MMLALCVVTTLAAAVLAYLCSPNQRWLERSLTAKAWRVFAVLLTVSALTLWARVAGSLVGTVVMLTLQMLLFGLLPLTPLLWRRTEE